MCLLVSAALENSTWGKIGKIKTATAGIPLSPTLHRGSCLLIQRCQLPIFCIHWWWQWAAMGLVIREPKQHPLVLPKHTRATPDSTSKIMCSIHFAIVNQIYILIRACWHLASRIKNNPKVSDDFSYLTASKVLRLYPHWKKYIRVCCMHASLAKKCSDDDEVNEVFSSLKHNIL